MFSKHFLILVMVTGIITCLSASCSAQPTINPVMIVNFLNRVRANIQAPWASNIRRMEWNDELAELAQSHADGCSLAENPRRMTSSFKFIGENRDVSTGVKHPNTYVQDVLNAWVESGNHYDYDRNICTDNVDCGRYTQLVWAETFRVGCGVNVCDPGAHYFLVCNFHPRGNYYGSTAYSDGEQCISCDWTGNI